MIGDATGYDRGQTMSLRHHNARWDILTASDSVFATAPTFDGCAHLADAERVEAFGIAGPASNLKASLTADGRIHIAAKRRHLTVYFHVVGQPIPVTAVTSPQAMVHPLVVSVRDN
jgi:hypothetical protein